MSIRINILVLKIMPSVEIVILYTRIEGGGKTTILQFISIWRCCEVINDYEIIQL